MDNMNTERAVLKYKQIASKETPIDFNSLSDFIILKE
jgi:hypothetical protein